MDGAHGTAADEVVRPLLGGDRGVALLDYPRHTNVGDSAIHLGELAYLQSLGIRKPLYSCDRGCYSPDALLARLGGAGTILMHGGGNFGDLWPAHQRFRERVLRDFPGTPIVFLPQSIHFRSKDALERAKDALNRHPRLTLLLRDRESLELARAEFRATCLLCPDMAFALGPLDRPDSPVYPALWVARTDHEASPLQQPGPDDACDVHRVDWLEEPATTRRVLDGALHLLCRRAAPARGRLSDLLSASAERLAGERLRRGCHLLSMGQVVVTDRLHGHILCLLLGIPHLLLDNVYRKVGRFFDTWTRDCGIARRYDHSTGLLRQVEELRNAGWS
jgi:exopolysaccharide biosynthesis predicted pyruvyltransferase EpsI